MSNSDANTVRRNAPAPRAGIGWALLRRIHWLLDRASAALWLSGFTLAGRMSRSACSTSDPGERAIVIIAPHPDDELAGCGGTLLRHLSAGARVSVLIVTDGRRSAACGLEPQQMAETRREEARAAAEAMGLEDSRWLGLPEGNWSPDDLYEPLVELLREQKPELIYAPSCIDFHPEHRKVAEQLARCLADDVAVRLFQSQVPLTRILANVAVDVTENMDELANAATRYRTQAGSLRGLRRTRRYAASFHRVGHYAEEFSEMSGAEYTRLHHRPPPAASFRGLRPAAFTDPLAYWTGRSMRRKIRDSLGA